MLEHISSRIILYFILYGGAAVAAIMICIYLLLRKGNAFAADITPPMRLRRWAAAFYAVTALGHIWWFLFYILSGDTHSWGYVVVIVLDCVVLLTTISGTLLSMLQDYKRPLWPINIALVPIVVLGVLQIAWPGVDFITPCLLYVLAVYVLFTIYMVIAVRQYGRWLRDNYADLEHKEVWLSYTLLIMLLLLVVNYGFASDDESLYLIRITDFLLFGILLWRVETLPQLQVSGDDHEEKLSDLEATEEPIIQTHKAPTIPSDMGQRLAKHCEETQLYLQYDLTVAQLAAIVGTNRYYLSQYFSSQGLTYNAYINNLRIDHFVRLYRDAIASQRSFTIRQLAGESGYRSYSTFSLAFKQRMGQSVTTWIRDME